MSKTLKISKQFFTAVCVIFILSGVAASQNEPVANQEKANFYELTKTVPNALAAGETEKAKTYAETLLKQAENHRDDWNYGNAVHVANLVLGHLALDSGNLDEAKRFLLEAGKTPGSPQLNSFGPNMLLAGELLEKEEYETVLKYFELCAVFWKNQNSRLDKWKALVIKKEMPGFGANLVYQMGDLNRAKQNKKQS